MLYVDRTLASDEEILAVGRFHWTYTLNSWLWLLLAGWALVGILIFVDRSLKKHTTEIAITNHRFVYKRGFIRRQTDEFTTPRITAINLKQSMMGRLLGYGKLYIHASGIGDVNLPAIARPLQFRRALIQSSAWDGSDSHNSHEALGVAA
ncbi:MAG: PH domain-containing protein [Alphaproteobacteria bacterium]|nr:MAG: PH domain-containing protein [Alphaproteobacteria bacterium]